MKLRVLALLALVALAAAAANEEETSKKRPLNFVRAETRVTDLITKLDAVSNHAERATDEIHSTLRELWQIVDLLGHDRCGDVVERVRVLQRKAGARVEKLEAELKARTDLELALQADVRARTQERDDARARAAEASAGAENARAEVLQLEEKLRKATTDRAREGAYREVSERLSELRVSEAGRQDSLARIVELLEEERTGSVTLGTKLEGALEGLRAVESDDGDSAVEARLKKELALVTQQLRAVKMEREDGAQELAKLQREVGRLRAGKGLEQKVVFHDGGEGASWTGTLALCAISIGVGGIIAYAAFGFSSVRASSPPSNPAGGTPQDKYATYTPNQRTPEGYAQQPRTSPLTYLNDSNKSTPHSATPRLY